MIERELNAKTQAAIDQISKSVQDLTGSIESSANAQLRLEEEALKTGASLSKVTDQFGRLNEKGLEALTKAMGSAGKEFGDQMKAIQKNTDGFVSKVNDAFGRFAKRIPVLGKTLERGFASIMDSLRGRLDKLFNLKFRMGAGAGAVGGLLGAGAAGFAALLGKQFNAIEKASISIAKSTGLSGKNLKNLTSSMVAAQNASYAMGISMDETAKASAALVTTLGNFRKITPELIQQTSMLAKFTGASAEEAGKFVGTLTKGFGKSADDIDTFVNGIASFATREGVNARKVLGDIVSDTNLMSIYMSRGENALKQAAVQAAKMGMSLAETQGVSEAFLDLEGGAELVGQINMYTGSSLNALEMFNLAAKNDTVAIMSRLNQAFSTPQGIRFIEDMPGLAKQFAGRFGMNLKQLRIAAGLDRDRSKLNKEQTQEQEKINKILQAQQTTFDKIKNTVIQTVFPVINQIAEKIEKFTKGVTEQEVKEGLKIAGVLGTIGLAAIISKGTRANPLYMIDVNRAGPQTSANPIKNVKRARDAYKGEKARGGTRGGAVKAGLKGLLRSGGMGGGLLKGAGKLLGRGGALGALFAIPELFDIISGGGGMAEIIPLLFSVIGGTGGALLGALGGPLGSIAGGTAGGYAGRKAGDLVASLFGGGAAKGQVVSSPRLFMVGEENRTEAIIPTERIRKGLPIDAGVARELGSIGVPGYSFGGFAGAQIAAAGEAQVRRNQATVQQGSQSDPAVIRERELAFQRQAQAARDEQRRMMANIEQKSLEILEEEKRIASNISNPSKDFGRGVRLFQRISKAAGEYAKKTAKRFADNLRKSNGDLGQALKMTWSQTVGDIEKLQNKLINKMSNMIGKLVNKLGNYLGNLAKSAGDKILGFAKDKLGINNRATAQQFDESVRQAVDQYIVDPATTAFNTTNQTNQEIAARRSQERMEQSTAVSDLSSQIADIQSQRAGLRRGSPQERALDRKQRELEAERSSLRNQRQMAFADETKIDSNNIAARIAGSIGGAIADVRAGFQRGRAFAGQDPATRGELNTEGFFAGTGARVGNLFGKLEGALPGLTEGIGAFTRGLDGASISMIASGDIAGAAAQMARKAAVDSAVKAGLQQSMPSLGQGNTGSILAGTSALAQGDMKGALSAVGMDIGRRGLTTAVNTLGGFSTASGTGMFAQGASIGGGVAAAGIGAMSGIMAGDYKAAAKGGLEGAAGYALGMVMPLPPPFNMMAGSILAGPVTDAVLTTGKELGKGVSNQIKGVGKIFKGDFKGGGKALLKGTGQILTSGFKGSVALVKGIGGIFGFGKVKPKQNRRKFLRRLMADLSAGKPLVGRGGRLRGNKKSQEMLAGALKMGKDGPDQKRLNEITAQVMTMAGVPMDIAQAFIYAALGADMNDSTLAHIDAEMGVGYEEALKNGKLPHQFDFSTKEGRNAALRFMEDGESGDIADNRETVADAQAASDKAAAEQRSGLIRQEIARLEEGGLTLEEVRSLTALEGGDAVSETFANQQALTAAGGTGINLADGNVYLDGVIVGSLSVEEADELRADGLPAPRPRNRRSGGNPRGTGVNNRSRPRTGRGSGSVNTGGNRRSRYNRG